MFKWGLKLLSVLKNIKIRAFADQRHHRGEQQFNASLRLQLYVSFVAWALPIYGISRLVLASVSVSLATFTDWLISFASPVFSHTALLFSVHGIEVWIVICWLCFCVSLNSPFLPVRVSKLQFNGPSLIWRRVRALSLTRGGGGGTPL